MSGYVLGIDPGNILSAYALIRSDGSVSAFDKVPNPDLLTILTDHADFMLERPSVAIEMVASYGMPVGAEVFETCVWIGRFIQALDYAHDLKATLLLRPDVKLHHCGQRTARDSNVRQALVDRFAPGQPNFGKGTKAAPGWFYGFTADVWQAYAVAVAHLDAIREA